MAEHPEILVIILRPSIVLGPHTRNIVSEVFRWTFSSFPWVLQVRGADPPMQFLSEEDIGEILYRAVRSEVREFSTPPVTEQSDLVRLRAS
jgi:nucleoside-diphosphate-sugar epimerase